MNLKHFKLLLKLQWFEHRRAWLVASAAIAAILALLLIIVWQWQTSFNGDTINGIFLILLFAGGGIFISTLLKDIGDKQKGALYLLLPASAASKLAIGLTYGVLAYLCGYLLLFYGIKALVVSILAPAGSSWGSFDLFKNGFYQFLFTFVSFQSVILLGSVYFNKSQFLKTLLVMIIGLFVFFNGNALLLKALTGERGISSNMPLDSFQFSYQGENIYVYPPYAAGVAVTIFLWVLLPACLWLITWYRLKEKEL